MKKISIYFLFCLVVVFASCEKTVTDVDIPKVPPQMVLFSFISPEEELTKVQLSISRPVFGEKRNVHEFVTNATVTITNDGGQSAQLIYADSNSSYNIRKWQFPIQPGRTYTITASTATYSIKASCTVPADVIDFNDVSYQRLSDGTGSGPTHRFFYKWDDKQGTKNYYRTITNSLGSNTGGGYERDICTNVYDDGNDDGRTFGENCEDYEFNQGQSREVRFYLLNTDVHYYEYHKRRLNYFGEDPFSEPFPQYSNIEGGLGVFCSYRKAVRTLNVE